MSFSKTLYPQLSTGSTQEDRKTCQHDLKIVDWDIKYQQKQKSIIRLSLFDLILYVPSTVFQLCTCRDRSSWVEPVLS